MVNTTQNDSNKLKTFTRLNKNRPQELSSKRPVSTFRNILPVKKQEFIDPRFSSAFGEYKPDRFRKSYSFINDMRMKEKEALSLELKQEEDAERREAIKSALSRLKQQIKSYNESEKKKEFEESVKKKAMQEAKQGKRPHFINKCKFGVFFYFLF